ncbi:hypothetical protein QYB59_000112 [Clostridium perfringens]|nr:hypothetical protein [Clostridium perfringens]
MSLEVMDYYRDLQSLYDECKNCISYHIVMEMKDGTTFDGIIDEVDTDNVTVLVGEDVIMDDPEDPMGRQRPPMGGRPRRRFRRFRRRKFPIRNINRFGLLGFPFIGPPFPFFPIF